MAGTAAAAEDAGAAGEPQPGGINPADFLEQIGAAVVMGIKMFGAWAAHKKGFRIREVTDPRAKQAEELGDNLTAESVKQTIIRYLPSTATIHPVVGLVAGAAVILGVQAFHLEQGPPEASGGDSPNLRTVA